ncbi:hypothetical protein JZU51_02440, partial [bacterium]|nr:hypothetical protein [bacterium]
VRDRRHCTFRSGGSMRSFDIDRGAEGKDTLFRALELPILTKRYALSLFSGSTRHLFAFVA